ncbi:MAG: rhodanese-like domain-containing protein [Nanoarchaeota archaeon]
MINVEELLKKFESKDEFLLIDVRTSEEYANGHIKKAILIPYNEVNSMVDISKHKEIIVYCRTENRSPIAKNALMQQEFKNVSVLKGGITEWIKNGYPISK